MSQTDKTENQNKMGKGTWDKMSSEETERLPKVVFDIGKNREVVFLENEPREFGSAEDAYYLFNVEEVVDGKPVAKVILTSAWSLLKGVKALAADGGLAGKKALISKHMKDGKQHFEVQPMSVATEQVA